MKKAVIIGFVLSLVPAIASAQAGVVGGRLAELVVAALGIVNLLIPLLIGIALIVFFWGLIKYIQSGKEGKNIMIAGLVGLFLMVSVWGIIRLVSNTLGVDTGQVNVPKIDTNYGY